MIKRWDYNAQVRPSFPLQEPPPKGITMTCLTKKSAQRYADHFSDHGIRAYTKTRYINGPKPALTVHIPPYLWPQSTQSQTIADQLCDAAGIPRPQEKLPASS